MMMLLLPNGEPDLSSLAGRLRWAMDRAGKSNQSELAREIGVKPQAIQYLIEPKNGATGSTHIAALAAALQVSSVWLATGTGNPLSPNEQARPASAAPPAALDELIIRQYEDVSGGMDVNGKLVLDEQIGSIRSWKVNHEWLRLHVPAHTGLKNLAIVTGFGPSMKPMFNPGDPLLVDTGVKTVDHEGVYFFRVGDEGFIKIIQRVPEFEGAGVVLRIISKNADFPPYDISPKNPHFAVLAKVLTVWKSEQY